MKVHRLTFSDDGKRYTHNLFRYPAKFHAPVARKLIELHSKPGETILDPFCGSGTLLVEALIAGRSAIGTDVDPLALFVAHAKTRRPPPKALRAAAAAVEEKLVNFAAIDLKRFGSFEDDIGVTEYARSIVPLRRYAPHIPQLEHWFRLRVVLQLARILRLIDAQDGSPSIANFLLLCFASIIRNSSNADPVPVSGLEVTAHMLRKEAAGRSIDPYALMQMAMRRGVTAVESFLSGVKHTDAEARVRQADARSLRLGPQKVDAVITSPPYLSAVDYYRRHQLEMFWLRLVGSPSDRLQLLPLYIGRNTVPRKQFYEVDDDYLGSETLRSWSQRLIEKPQRLRALHHYAGGMARSLAQMSKVVRAGASVVVVIGDSQIQGEMFPTSKLVAELAPDDLQLSDLSSYPIQNRYMSYTRHNGANIKQERVLSFQKR